MRIINVDKLRKDVEGFIANLELALDDTTIGADFVLDIIKDQPVIEIKNEDIISKIFYDDKYNDSVFVEGYREGFDKGTEIGAELIKSKLKQRKGEFVNARDGYDGHVKCNKCFKTYDWTSQAQYYNFCPNCGYPMKKVEDENENN